MIDLQAELSEGAVGLVVEIVIQPLFLAELLDHSIHVEDVELLQQLLSGDGPASQLLSQVDVIRVGADANGLEQLAQVAAAAAATAVAAVAAAAPVGRRRCLAQWGSVASQDPGWTDSNAMAHGCCLAGRQS